jgi:hypothetical protein
MYAVYFENDMGFFAIDAWQLFFRNDMGFFVAKAWHKYFHGCAEVL